jgi:hypothetical protein
MQVQRFGECWASRSYPMVAGIDRNAPKMDHPDLARAVWFWEEERRVFGSDTAHDLRDVLRTYLETHPRKLRRIVKERPDGPLATSFMRGKGKGHKPGRYDAIYASPELEVRDVRYPFDEAIAAGSDHGLVWAELELRSDYVAPAGMRSGFWKDRSRGQRRTREVKG